MGNVRRRVIYAIACVTVAGAVAANLCGLSDALVTCVDLLSGLLSLVAMMVWAVTEITAAIDRTADRVKNEMGDFYAGLRHGHDLAAGGGHGDGGHGPQWGSVTQIRAR